MSAAMKASWAKRKKATAAVRPRRLRDGESSIASEEEGSHCQECGLQQENVGDDEEGMAKRKKTAKK